MTKKKKQLDTLNPWFTIWTRPRATMRSVLDTDPRRMVLVLAMLAGFAQALDKASLRHVGDRLPVPAIFLIAALAGSVIGILTLYLSGALLTWTGKWLNGKATPQHARAAVAWSNVPLIWALILWVPELMLFGKELFLSETPVLDGNPLLIIIFLLFAVIELLIGIWAFVIFLKCLGEAQQFSAWKALANALIALVIFLIPATLVAVIVFGIRG